MKGGNQNPREQARGAISVGALERGHPESWQEPPFCSRRAWELTAQKPRDTPGTRILSRRSGGSESTTAVCGSVTLI